MRALDFEINLCGASFDFIKGRLGTYTKLGTTSVSNTSLVGYSIIFLMFFKALAVVMGAKLRWTEALSQMFSAPKKFKKGKIGYLLLKS